MPRKQAKGLSGSSPPLRSATDQVSHIAAMSARSPVHVPALEQLERLRKHMECLKKDMAKAALKGNLDKVASLAFQLQNAKGQFALQADRVKVEGELPEVTLFKVEGKEQSGNPGWAYAPQAKRGFTRAKQQLGRAKTRRTYG